MSRNRAAPCEGCRQHKRKCNSNKPCDRCKRLGYECVYIVSVKPLEVEYLALMDKIQLAGQIDSLFQCLQSLEQEICSLRTAPHNQTAPIDSPSQAVIKHSWAANWAIILDKKGLQFHTNILSHIDLLHLLVWFGRRQQFNGPTIPLSTPTQPILQCHVPWSTIRRSHYQATRQCITARERQAQDYDADDYLDYPAEADTDTQARSLVLKLLHAYFHCYASRTVVLHEATFYRLFVDGRKDPTASSAVCALCAVITTMHCRHVQVLMTREEQIRWSDYFFERAREAVSCRFDEPTLETLVTYWAMAAYKSNLLLIKGTETYLQMAIRIWQILDDSRCSLADEGECELLVRLSTGLTDVGRYMDFVNNRRGVPAKGRRMESLSGETVLVDAAGSHSVPQALDDENRTVARALVRDRYIKEINSILCPYLRAVRFEGRHSIPVDMVLSLEQALMTSYAKQIPTEFQIASDVFEDGLTDAEFRQRLQKDPHSDVCSVLVAARYHQALLALHEPFLPSTGSTLSATGSLQEILTPAVQVGVDTKDISVHAIRAQDICHRASVIVVRLLSYFVEELKACHLPLSILLHAWDIHVRNASLGATSTTVPPHMISTARTSLLQCMTILRKGYYYNHAEKGLWEHFQTIQSQLLSAFVDPTSTSCNLHELGRV